MGAKILLVEDNEQNRYLVTFLLEKAGHQIMHAQTGQECVQMAQADRPDLILLDIHMPEMDGYQAAELLRATPGLEDVPLVAVTSYAMAGDRKKALDVGFAGYIEKPISAETFAAEISKFIPTHPHENLKRR